MFPGWVRAAASPRMVAALLGFLVAGGLVAHASHRAFAQPASAELAEAGIAAEPLFEVPLWAGDVRQRCVVVLVGDGRAGRIELEATVAGDAGDVRFEVDVQPAQPGAVAGPVGCETSDWTAVHRGTLAALARDGSDSVSVDAGQVLVWRFTASTAAARPPAVGFDLRWRHTSGS